MNYSHSNINEATNEANVARGLVCGSVLSIPRWSWRLTRELLLTPTGVRLRYIVLPVPIGRRRNHVGRDGRGQAIDFLLNWYLFLIASGLIVRKPPNNFTCWNHNWRVYTQIVVYCILSPHNVASQILITIVYSILIIIFTITYEWQLLVEGRGRKEAHQYWKWSFKILKDH